jgi:sulfur-oxidizing protein SoxY
MLYDFTRPEHQMSTASFTAAGRRRVLRLLAGMVALTGFGSRLQAAQKRKSVESPLPADGLPEALAHALGGQQWKPSSSVTIELPQIAENGAIVPITIESRLPGTRRILLFAEHNPGPLLAEFEFASGADPWVSLRVKLNESGPVLAIAESNSEFFGARVEVTVMRGGCG